MSGEDFTMTDFLPYLLNQAAEKASASFSDIYKTRYGMLRTDWRVLFHLGIFGSMTARDIARKTREDKTRISRAVARLEGWEYLSRTADTTDRRAEWLTLTPKGRAVYDDLSASALAHDHALSKRIGARDTARLKEILARIASSAD